MDRLVELHQQHDATGLPAELRAAWLHHRFAQIHPFQDGNGRVARAIASLVLIQAGQFPLVITRDDRVAYLDALEAADRGDLRSVIRLFVAKEKRWFVKALSLADQVQGEAERVDQMIDAIGDIFSTRRPRVGGELDRAKATAADLWSRAIARFEQLRGELEPRIRYGSTSRRVLVDSAEDGDTERRHWHRYQVVHASQPLDYYANLAEFHQWVRLKLFTENGRAEILVSFHGLGRDYRGVLGVSGSFYRREEADNIEHQIMEFSPVSEEIFQINYLEQPEAVELRFARWLETVLLRGLDQWRRGEE